MELDPAILSALSALGGSAIGAAATLANTWMTGRAGRVAEAQKAEAAKREAEDPAVLVRLHALTSWMRLVSSAAVLRAAESVVVAVLDAYTAPNRTLLQLREEHAAGASDPLEGFGDACRLELAALRR